jgi:hypothetical protein
MTHHPDLQLSAYLDGSLPAEENRALEAHLQTCPECTGHLAELRAVAGLLARLPDRAPRRSLLPRRLPAWLVPARWASSLAAASFAVLFAASLVRAVPFAAPTSGAPAPGAELAPAAATATVDAKDRTEQGALQAVSPTPQATGVFAGPSPTPRATGVARREMTDGAGSVADRAERTMESVPAWLWLLAALASGGVAIGLHRTMRRLRA